jgi:hypothetical protein
MGASIKLVIKLLVVSLKVHALVHFVMESGWVWLQVCNLFHLQLNGDHKLKMLKTMGTFVQDTIEI